MGERQAYVALDWVTRELSETLKQAQQAMAAFEEDPDDHSRLQFCLTYLHQVRGTLEMVEVFGGALVAGELEQLAAHLVENPDQATPENQSLLLQGILQLPAYLDRLQQGGADHPGILAPLIDEIRTARAVQPIDRARLFAPDLDSSAPELSQSLDSDQLTPELLERLQRLRQLFQFSLLGYLRGNSDADDNLDYLRKASERLARLLEGSGAELTWTMSSAILTAAQYQLLAPDADLKPLLMRLERQLKQQTRAVANRQSPTSQSSLIQHLLYYVATASPETKALANLQARFDLHGTETEQARIDTEKEALKGPDKDTVNSVSRALVEELTTVKEQLDLFARSGQSAPDGLQAMVQPLRQIHDTLGLLRMNQAQRVLSAQIDTLNTLSTQSEVDNKAIMDVAGGLLYVESTLSALSVNTDVSPSATPEVGAAQKVLISEVRNAIESCKEATVAYIGSQWDREKLTEVPELLKQIEANLEMIPLSEPAAVINTIRSYVSRELLGEGRRVQSDWDQMDRLADALMGVDYYLEQLPQAGKAQSASILQRASDSLASLGYTVQLADQGDLEHDSDVQLPQAEAAVTDTLDDYFDTVDDLDESAIDAAIDASEAMDSRDTSETPRPDFDDPDTLESDQDDDLALFDLGQADTPLLPDTETDNDDDEDFYDLSDDDLSMDDPAHFAEANAMVLTGDPDNMTGFELPGADKADQKDQELQEQEKDEDDLIDDDIREIFLEEAEEVLADINTWFPPYRADPENTEALTELRRSFHTLKGSGRMVKAQVVGELAWSVENMLNRLLEGTIDHNDALIRLLEEIIDTLPGLVDDFAQGRKSDQVAVDALAARADALARGKPEPTPPEPTEDTTPEPTESASSDEGQSTSEKTDSPTVDSSGDDNPENKSEPDDQLFEIFQQEIRSHLDTVQNYLKTHRKAKKPKVDDALQRALHTIKGSAHMAGITPMADMVTPVEQLVKSLQVNREPMAADMRRLLQETTDLASKQLDAVADGEEAPTAPQAFFDRLKDQQARLADRSSDQGENGNQNLMAIFLNEAMNTLLNAEETLSAWQKSGLESTKLKHLKQDLTTLADAARAIELLPLSSLANQLILLYEFLQHEPPESADNPAFDALYRAHEALIDMMDRLAAGQSVQGQKELEQELAELAGIPVAGPDELELDDELNALPYITARAETTKATSESEPEPEPQAPKQSGDNDRWFSLTNGDSDILDIFLEEAGELLDSIHAELEQWHGSPSDLTPVSALQRDLHTLKGGARMAEATPVGDLAHELEFIYEAVSNGQLEPATTLLNQAQVAQDAVAQMIQDLTEHQGCQVQDELISQLHSLRTGQPPPAEPGTIVPVAQQNETALDSAEKSDRFFSEQELTNLDSDILDVFVDEAGELIHELDEAIAQWRQRPSNELAADELKRVLHTLKGGARLARLPSLGTLSHELETFVVRAQQNRIPLDDSFFNQVLAQYDQLATAIDQLQTLIVGDIPAPRPDNTVVPFQRKSEGEDPDRDPSDHTGMASGAGDGQAEPVRRVAPQETVKVNAGLLENLVNLAGESSISRARIEEQVNDLGFTLSELDTTIDRLRDKVRELDLETEAQVLFRQERAEETNFEDFDPLEMDRYSHIQQLSRSLMETSSDLFDLRNTLGNKTRDTETVLLQQSRIHSDLQEGLMQSRMVPFSRLVPRLRRIVRQIGQELDKSVRFEIANADGEMDRSVLERMISPLEHMLRNAVDHGVESPEKRKAAGKDPAGQITLSLMREGGEILLTLKDDGRGIDVNGVRRKAIERGLMTEDEDLPDQAVLQFILSAGFSTATEVTQISGRGVGMDVVANEVKALGGSMDIETDAGTGTTFIVRLPFTVSVNRALMVGTGDDIYALPLNTIDGVARVQPDDLIRHLAEEGPHFEYGGQSYRMMSLSRLIGNQRELPLEELDAPQPVILVKALDRKEPVALHVDRLMGSREVVVKTLGPQFTSVPSVSGATILGDGSVVIILDLPAMLRSERTVHTTVTVESGNTDNKISRLPSAATERVAEPDKPIRIMVVDDSVTVRKVTSRLLERYGMKVWTAKDGMDAMAQLQDHIPELILLDIEMPRMDGFEVANRVRHTDRLQHIPIIMITSRTGEKHKERALEIGVDEYMGKPFQEGPLLEAIERLVSS